MEILIIVSILILTMFFYLFVIKKNKDKEKEIEKEFLKEEEKTNSLVFNKNQEESENKKTEKEEELKEENSVLKTVTEKIEEPIEKNEREEYFTEKVEEVVEKIEEVLPEVHIRPTCTEFNIENSATELRMDIEDIEDFIFDIIDQIEDSMVDIYHFTENEDYKELKKKIHSLKGSATNLRINCISEVLIELDQYLLAGDIRKQKVELYLLDLEFYFEKLKENFN